MNHALVEALDGVEIFDPQKITDGVIVDNNDWLSSGKYFPSDGNGF